MERGHREQKVHVIRCASSELSSMREQSKNAVNKLTLPAGGTAAQDTFNQAVLDSSRPTCESFISVSVSGARSKPNLQFVGRFWTASLTARVLQKNGPKVTRNFCLYFLVTGFSASDELLICGQNEHLGIATVGSKQLKLFNLQRNNVQQVALVELARFSEPKITGYDGGVLVFGSGRYENVVHEFSWRGELTRKIASPVFGGSISRVLVDPCLGYFVVVDKKKQVSLFEVNVV